MKILGPTWMALLALCVGSCSQQPEPEPVLGALPIDVVDYTGRRNLCDFYRTVRPGKEDEKSDLRRRRQEMCLHADEDLTRLRRDYAEDPRVLRALARYADHVQAP